MAIQTNVSVPATGDVAMFELKEMAKAHGWSVAASGNGLATFNGSGDVFASALDLIVDGAWFKLKMGATTRMILVSRKTGPLQWTIKYSPSGFAGGSATTLPTSASSRTLIDGVLLGADGTFNWLLTFEDVAPFGFAAMALTTGTLAAVTGIALLGMETGSYDSADQDPYVAIATATSVFAQDQIFQAEASTYRNFHAWYRFNTGDAAWAGAPFGSVWFGQGNIGDTNSIVSRNILSSVSGKEVPISILCGFRQPPNFGIKGVVRGAKYVTSSTGSAPNGTHLTDGNGGYWVRVGDLWIQWDSNVPSL